MADRKPLKVLPDGGGDSTGLSEFRTGDTIGVANGGTGLTTVATSNLLTGNGADPLSAEANLTFDGTRLGVNNTSPSTVDGNTDVIVVGDGNANADVIMYSPTTGNSVLGFTDTADTTNQGFIQYLHGSDNTLKFGTSATERMRISSAGDVSIGNASSSQALFINRTDTGSGAGDPGFYYNPSAQQLYLSGTTILQYLSMSNTGNIMGFRYNDSPTGGISIGTSSTTFDTSSDYRLKENVVIMANATERVSNLLPIRFNWKVDPSVEVDGFLAHEAALVVPEAVIGLKDERRTINDVVMDANGVKIDKNIPEDQWIAGKADGRFSQDSTWVAEKEVDWYQTIDNSKFVPLLTAAIQELTARITALESA